MASEPSETVQSASVNVTTWFTAMASKSHIPTLPLANRNKRQQTVIVMKHWTRHTLFIFLLGVFVTLGMGLSVVKANTMSIEMAMADGMGIAHKSDCNDCINSKALGKTTVCAASCMASAPTLLSPADFTMAALTTPASPRIYLPLHSRAYPPDPYPPRTNYLG